MGLELGEREEIDWRFETKGRAVRSSSEGLRMMRQA